MGQRKNKGYLLWIFFFLFVLIGCGKQNEQREIPILPDNIPKKFLEREPDYEKYPIYERKVTKEMEEWEWAGETSFEIEKRKEQKGAWITYYPVLSSSSYPEEAKKINENLELYLKSWQEAYFEEQWSEMFYERSTIYEDALLYMLTFDVVYHSKEEISIVFDFLVWMKDEWRWEEKDDLKDFTFVNFQSQTLYIFVPSGELFPYQDTTRYAPSLKDGYIKDDIVLESHENEVSSYQIERFEKEFSNMNRDTIIWVYPQLNGEGEQIEKINADIKADYEILFQYANGSDDELYPSLPTQNDYYITYNDEHVISILYEYVCWFEMCKTPEISRSGFYNAVYDLNTGEKIRYEDLIDSSQMEAFTSLLYEIYPRDNDNIDDIFYVDNAIYLDNPVYYLRENEISFLGSGEFPRKEFELYPMEEMTIPYVLVKKIKTDHLMWDWLLRTK